jgi:hypothetical protein
MFLALESIYLLEGKGKCCARIMWIVDNMHDDDLIETETETSLIFKKKTVFGFWSFFLPIFRTDFDPLL